MEKPYDRCLTRSLRTSDFSIPDSGTIEMKLSVLPQMINISKTAKMIGEYSFSKSLLYTEKLAGNVTACVGFVRDDRFYIPNTVLREDIRDITKRPQKRVLAVFKCRRGQRNQVSQAEKSITAIWNDSSLMELATTMAQGRSP
ncbi:MAG: hypothetical protein IJ617_02145 [Oscillospiraceae bacterium]|nr:hypothetical protein [Oscillospiraceae bacterium]